MTVGDPACLLCRERLAALERVAVSHESRLCSHEETLAELKAALSSIVASQSRGEERTTLIISILERREEENRRLTVLMERLLKDVGDLARRVRGASDD
jgi:hypothetical protein